MNKKYLLFILLLTFLISSCSMSKIRKTNQQIAEDVKDLKTEIKVVKEDIQKQLRRMRSNSWRENLKWEIYSDLENKPSDMDFIIKHSPPISQDKTGTCWCFSTTSFLEAEIIRLGHKYFDLSEMHTVYYAYLVKAEKFIDTKGEQTFGQGGLSHDVIHIAKNYGLVRQIDYYGKLQGQLMHNHSRMSSEIHKILDDAKKSDNWNKKELLNNVKDVLNKYMGKPPEEIEIDGKKMTPVEFANDFLNLPFDEYIEITSYSYMPFYKKGTLDVRDNWMQNDQYYNVPLDVFMEQFKSAIRDGYTIAIDYDVSELGNIYDYGYYIIPKMETKPEEVNQETRDEMFENKKTRDEHLVHIVGFKEGENYDWYLVRDSSVAFRSPFRGYQIMRDDYVQLKVLAYMIHKDALIDKISQKF